MTISLDRRTFIKHMAATAAAMSATAIVPAMATGLGAPAVPNDAISAKPRLPALANACDAHIHILDKRFPSVAPGVQIPANMNVAAYRQLQNRLGTERVVVVQPKPYGTNNDCLLEALTQFNGQARGIAVIDSTIADSELERLHTGGVRGVRFSVWNAKDAVVSIDMLEPVAERISDLGWHVQLHMSGDQIVEHQALLKRLKTPMVFDHMGRLPPAQGVQHPAFGVMTELVQADKAWVKLAGAYLNTLSGPPYSDASTVARALVKLASERLVWGSDWPHTTEKHKPDSGQLYDLLENWAPSPEVRKDILVHNPATLYGFD